MGDWRYRRVKGVCEIKWIDRCSIKGARERMQVNQAIYSSLPYATLLKLKMADIHEKSQNWCSHYEWKVVFAEVEFSSLDEKKYHLRKFSKGAHHSHALEWYTALKRQEPHERWHGGCMKLIISQKYIQRV